MNIDIYSKDLVRFLKKKANKNGLLNHEMEPKDFLIGFIEGLIDSDGYVKRNYAEITSANERLKEQIKDILKILRIKFNERTYNYTTGQGDKTEYRIGFSLLHKKFNPIKWQVVVSQTAG